MSRSVPSLSRVLRPRLACAARLSILLAVGLLPGLASAAVQAPPSDARVLTFDEVAAPASFFSTQPVTGEYKGAGVTFVGVGSDGGAVLAATTFGDISGYSAPNFLAFNSDVGYSGGGHAAMPETMQFRQPVSRVQLDAAGEEGNLHAEVLDKNGALLGSQDFAITGAMSTMVLQYPRISSVRLTSNVAVVAIDNIAFTLDTTILNFDELGVRPASFSQANALRDEYLAKGVRFYGGNADDGGSVLDQGIGFGVSGHSQPNFLALRNDGTTTHKFGGKPMPPQYISFEPVVKFLRFKQGGSTGGTMKLELFDAASQPIGELTATVESTMKTVAIAVGGIAKAKITGTFTDLAIDDIEYLVDGTMIDFDDTTGASFFSSTTALRDRYQTLGMTVEADGKTGPAISNAASFFLTGYSQPNILAWNSDAQYSDDGYASLPASLVFAKPIQRFELHVGSFAGGNPKFFVEGFNVLGESVGTSDVYMNGTMQNLALDFEGAVKVTINSTGYAGGIDNLFFKDEDPCVHDLCRVGEALDRACDTCAMQVCNTNSECCNNGWTLACSKMAEDVCSFTCDPLCGDATNDRRILAGDALFVLRAAVQSTKCPLQTCDFSGDAKVTASDALGILKASVGQSVTPKCPPPVAP